MTKKMGRPETGDEKGQTFSVYLKPSEIERVRAAARAESERLKTKIAPSAWAVREIRRGLERVEGR